MPSKELKISQRIIDDYRWQYVKAVGLGVEDDETLEQALLNSYRYIVDKVGYFDIEKEENRSGRLLVYNHARYERGNVAELFYKNFLNDMNSFGWELRWREGEENNRDESDMATN